tara:strand:- start:1114 stop:2874 length:1761 start_codon:yes stop_codon:yes gene_type:complete
LKGGYEYPQKLQGENKMADVKNFGLKGVSNDVQLGKSGGRFKWVSASDRYEFTGSDGSTLKAIRAGNVDVQGSLLSNDITSTSISINGDATITGDLTVNGSTTTVSSTNTTIADSILELATGTTGTPANDVGLVIERGDSDNVFMGWDESEDKVVFGTGTFTGSSTGSLTYTAADMQAAAITGTDITGTGTVQFGSLSDGSITVTAFQTTLTDSDTLIGTSGAVKDYVDGEVTTLNSAISTANTNLKAYVDGLDRDDDLAFTGDDATGRTLDLDSGTLTIAGGTGITSASGASSVTLGLDNTAVSAGSYGDASTVATFTVDAQGRITAAGTASIATSLTIQSDDAADNVVALASDKLKILGGSNITTSNSADDLTIALDSTISGLTSVSATTLTDGTASISSGAITGATSVTASGTVQFGSLSDGAVTLTAFTAEGTGISATDNDTTVPTSAAVKDYVDNNAGDGLVMRTSFTADSTENSFDIGTVPNVSGRTYYAARVILNVTTGISGGSVDGMLVKDNAGSGNTLAASTTNDIAIGTYVVDLPFASALTKNAAVSVAFVQANGSTAAVPTAGVVTGVVEYKYTI